MLDNSRLVSVIMPAYKKKYLAEAISSVLNQTYKNIEFIIVNDKSPEDLTSVVESFHDKRIQYYINEVNVGGKDPVANWNKCLSYAKGEFVSLLCDDDMYESTYIEEMIVLADKYPSVDVFRARVQFVDKSQNLMYLEGTSAEYLKPEDFIMHFLSKKIHLTISEWFLRRARVLECGGYYNAPMAWFSDSLSMFRFALKAGMVSNPKILVTFRQSGLNISSNCRKYGLKMVDAISYFEDGVIKMVENETMDFKKANLNLLKLYTKECRDRDFANCFCIDIIKGVFHRKKYRLSTDIVIKALWIMPIHFLSRIRAKLVHE